MKFFILGLLLFQTLWVLSLSIQVPVIDTNGYIPVYVMMPLDTITTSGKLTYDNSTLNSWFDKLKSCNVDGVNLDVWWGVVEISNPKHYNWKPYLEFASLVKNKGLKLQMTMSFHQCGGNVGDDCNVPLPSWVLSVGNSNPDIFYTDQEGHRDKEYLSLGVDTESVFSGRTAVDIYSDFMSSFSGNFSSYLGSTITDVQVGLGPAGELRYPSYQLDRWTFPGVGEFQCYDRYMLSSLSSAASDAGHPEWGYAGPSNAGTYNSWPDDTGFFSNGYDNYASSYGQFFLNWYTKELYNHGDRVLSKAHNIFSKYSGLQITAKISGVHWQYKHPSHAAELTAGYKNDKGSGYDSFSSLFSKYGIGFDFTCLEMKDSEQQNCNCAPEELVHQTEYSAKNYNVKYFGENALQRYDTTAYNQILSESYYTGQAIGGFTYLRLSDTLFQGSNWSNFCNFVNSMHS